MSERGLTGPYRGFEHAELAMHVPALGKRPIADLRRRDFIDLIEQLHDDSGGATANRVLSQLRAICRWAVSRDYLAGDPTALVAKPHKEQARQRVLSDRELKAVWNAKPWGATAGAGAAAGPDGTRLRGRRNALGEIDEAAASGPCRPAQKTAERGPTVRAAGRIEPLAEAAPWPLRPFDPPEG
jgi:hypothetical protein